MNTNLEETKLMFMDIQETRRANLARWLETHTVPPREKSLFSQLKGGGSFGERVARRLENDYGMGSGYLDQGGEPKPSNTGQKAPLSAEAELLIQCVLRLDGLGPVASQMFAHHAALLTLAEQMMGMQDDEVVRELHIHGQKLADHIDPTRAPQHAKRDHKTKGSH